MSPPVRVAAPLDPGFVPAVLTARNYTRSVCDRGEAVPLVIGLERQSGLISRYETVVRPRADPETLFHVERLVKCLLWARGGWKVHFGGPRAIGEHIAKCYSENGPRAFDVELMRRVYERPFEVMVTDAPSVPPENEAGVALGGHLDGCRIGFDLGASDYKVAALKDGTVVYSEEFPWNPRDQPDPRYHYDHISMALSSAAKHLPRVDAIGGSSAGVIVNNRIMVASLFRAVSARRFAQAANLFLRIREEWGVPVEVMNDGDVTALAGAMSLGVRGLLGIAMGSSQAAGFLSTQGGMTGWLNELAFAPIDFNPAAARDEWSGDQGVGVMYFSQQAVNRLLPAAGIQLPPESGLPERLRELQSLMQSGDSRAARIYETIGVYLGYAIAHYAEFYEFQHVLILGRVTTGRGSELILAKAGEVLAVEFPEFSGNVRLHVPDERSKRVGQAVAAASLPAI